MGLFVTSNADMFAARLRALRNRTGGECAAELLRYNALSVLKTTMKLDDKLAITHSTKGTTARAVREGAVRRSILRTMSPLDPESFTRSQRMKTSLLARMNDGNLEAINELLHRWKTPGARNQTAVHFAPRHHTAALRRHNGRTVLTYKRVVGKAEVEKLNEYITLRQSHVGYKFSGFLPAIEQLGGKGVPKYVTRHKGSPGWVKLDLSGPDQLIEVGNGASYDRKLGDRVHAAFAVRERALTTLINRLARGEAANLGFAVQEGGPNGRLISIAEWKASQKLAKVKNFSE